MSTRIGPSRETVTSAGLTADEFERVLRIKTDANQLFSAGEMQRAYDGWSAALRVYDGRLGSPEQRFTKGKILSNQAEAMLKLGRHEEARVCATGALECNPVDHKARFRRARALLGNGGFEELALAAEDVKQIKADGGTLGAAEAALLKTAQGPLLSLPAAGGGVEVPAALPRAPASVGAPSAEHSGRRGSRCRCRSCGGGGTCRGGRVGGESGK